MLALLPMAFAWPLFASWPSDAASRLRTAGKLTAVLGFTLFILAGLLSVRLPVIDRLFGGLTAIWRVHHWLGALAFLLLMAHPLLLALAAVPSSPAAAGAVLWPSLDHFAVWAGWLALIAMMVFLAPSFAFFGKPNYQRWKHLHALSAVALLAGWAHSALLAHSVPALFWHGAVALCVLAMMYRWVFSRWLACRPYQLESVQMVTHDVAELCLAPQNEALHFRPGQFVYVRHFKRDADAFREEHPYTISSSPDERSLRLAVKACGDGSRALISLAPGAAISIEGPYGEFFPHSAATQRELWIAGGIGIAPFLSRLRWLTQHAEHSDIELIYCTDRPERAHFLPELQELCEAVHGMQLHLHYFQQQGPVSADYLQRQCPDLVERQIFVCGPPALMKHLWPTLRRLGVRKSQLRSEDFNLL